MKAVDRLYERGNTLRYPGLALDNENRVCRQMKSALTGTLLHEFDGIATSAEKPVFISVLTRI